MPRAFLIKNKRGGCGKEPGGEKPQQDSQDLLQISPAAPATVTAAAPDTSGGMLLTEDTGQIDRQLTQTRPQPDTKSGDRQLTGESIKRCREDGGVDSAGPVKRRRVSGPRADMADGILHGTHPPASRHPMAKKANTGEDVPIRVPGRHPSVSPHTPGRHPSVSPHPPGRHPSVSPHTLESLHQAALLRYSDPRFWQTQHVHVPRISQHEYVPFDFHRLPHLAVESRPLAAPCFPTLCHPFYRSVSCGEGRLSPPFLPFVSQPPILPSLPKTPPFRLPTPPKGGLPSSPPIIPSPEKGGSDHSASLPWLVDTKKEDSPPSYTSTSSTRRNNDPPRYQCEACNKSYATFSGLSKHKQFHCASHVKKEFSCKYCDKTYTSLGALKMHIRTHTLPCKCNVCGKAFSRPWLLQGHVRTHTGEKPFNCAHCGRSFADRSNLRAHLQTHSDIKKYNCKTCSKTFSRMSLLLKHEDGSCPGLRPIPACS